ncbi:MAG TPA: endo-1,4-beta-xylanase [Candidatus Saccharimonadales bacterium]|nr:endo-1,4-beta-xylanase [Candidatus Saccharimonadales bacterium]
MYKLGRTIKSTVLRRKRLYSASVGALLVAFTGGAVLLATQTDRPKPQGKTMEVVHSTPTAALSDLLASGWNYMPGTATMATGVQVGTRDFKIVNQDGSGGQVNPPLNLYGTRLSVSGNFMITARLSNLGAAKAGLQLYANVPTIADEFRIEPASVRFTLTGSTLTVERWRANGSQPSQSQTFTVSPQADTNELRIERRDGQLVIALNSTMVGQISEQGTFRAGNVWFGLTSENGSWTLAGLKADPLAGGKVTVVNSAVGLTAKAKAADGLQTLAAARRPDFIVGAAAALGPAVADDAYASTLFGGNFGGITTENALKWQFVHPAPGVYDYHEADALVALAQKNGLKVHAHTLVFGEANPAWVRALPASQLESVMLDHIKNVVGHYKGKVLSWDVVNEPFDDDEWDQLRPNIWYKAMGKSYIAKAFTAAHAADPNAQLFINEYGLEEDGDRWDAMLALVKELQAQGVPITGVGFQSHVYAPEDKINAAVLKKHFDQLAALGLKARVSEMDVYSEDGQAVQADQYAQVFAACFASPNCVSFTSWGVSDRYDWFKDDDGSIQQGEDFLWDANMQPTPAVQAIRQKLTTPSL